jgi:tRNA(adenine34) deaminase
MATAPDLEPLYRAVEMALEAERRGNLPIGTVITINGRIISEAGNAILKPRYHPGRHAEKEALARVPPKLWPRSRDMICYTTLEPCLMCFGALLLHGVGQVVFGARDPVGGAGCLLSHLPEYYADIRLVPVWTGPVLPELCDPLYQRARASFDTLPCGKGRS